MNRMLLPLLLTCLALSTVPAPAWAEESSEPTRLDAVVVTGKPLVTPTRQTDDAVFTGTEITRTGLEAQGTRATTGVYEALNVLPGVNVESPEPFGLGAEQRVVRLRGVRGYLGAMTVEGVPNYGGNPMGPRDYLYDLENIRGVAVYKGAVPADLGTGVGARGGAVELRPLWPEEKIGADLSQSFGSYGYSRTFFRFDSGALPTLDSRLSLSYSYTDAEKWKGPGDQGPRQNINAMFAQPVGTKDEIRIWFNYNDVEQDLYRPLTFNETQSLDDNYRKDYADALTGVRASDLNYYKYNRASYLNRDILAVLPLSLTDSLRLTLKPYYSKEDADILGGSTSSGGVVQKRNRDIERYGLISEVGADLSLARLTLGYLYESSDMKIYTENYAPGAMTFAGYGVYTENDDDGHVHSPYLKLAGDLDQLHWQAGLKYFRYEEPSSTGFVSTAPTYALTRAADLDREAKTYDAWLPTVGLSYSLSPTVEPFVSYGRNQIRPYSYLPLISLYNQNRPAFQKAGVTLNDLFNGYDMEVTDTFELGTRLRLDWAEITPTLYYSRHQDLLTTVHDPRVNQSYSQNMGDATGYGFEIDANVFLTENLTFFCNPSYTVLTYDDDLTYQGATLDAKGAQVVDAPRWMVKTGVILTYEGFEIVPSLRYLGDRYGDVQHEEKIGEYVVADLKIGYTLKDLWGAKALKTSLELNNLFDKQYVSVVNASDDNRGGAASYYVGAPFTAVFKVGLDL